MINIDTDILPAFKGKRCQSKIKVANYFKSLHPTLSSVSAAIKVAYFVEVKNIAYSYDVTHYRLSNELKKYHYLEGYDQTIIKLLNGIKKKIKICLWETQVFYDCLNLQPSSSYYIIEVPKYALEFIKEYFLSKGLIPTSFGDFDYLFGNRKIILKTYNEYNPIYSSRQIYPYPNDEVIIARPKIEKLIVDLLVDRNLMFISQNERDDVATMLLNQFQVNLTTLLSYARSRNKMDVIKELLVENGFVNNEGEIIYD